MTQALTRSDRQKSFDAVKMSSERGPVQGSVADLVDGVDGDAENETTSFNFDPDFPKLF